EQLLVDEFIHAQWSELAAITGALDTAEGHFGTCGAWSINRHHAGFNLRCDLLCTLCVGRKYRATETEERVIGNGNGFVIGGELVDGCNGAEEFLVEGLRIHRDIGQHGRRVVSTYIGNYTAGAHGRAIRRGLFNLLSQTLRGIPGRQWAVLCGIAVI